VLTVVTVLKDTRSRVTTQYTYVYEIIRDRHRRVDYLFATIVYTHNIPKFYMMKLSYSSVLNINVICIYELYIQGTLYFQMR